MESTGVAKAAISAMQNIVDTYKKTYPAIDPAIWDEFNSQFNAEDLITLIIPIYDKYYTEKDLDQLIVFYKSPLGQKLIATMPGVMKDSMEAGQRWGKGISEKILRKLKEKGYTLTQ